MRLHGEGAPPSRTAGPLRPAFLEQSRTSSTSRGRSEEPPPPRAPMAHAVVTPVAGVGFPPARSAAPPRPMSPVSRRLGATLADAVLRPLRECRPRR
eukprot:scaffold1027_cov413-Prasinococcus_capsulatus_cf.AAC.5